MKGIYNASVFRLSVISSLLLFFSVMFGQYLWSQLWMLFGIIELAIIIFFVAMLVWSIVHWIKNRKTLSNTYYPFLVNVVIVALVVILPLNFIRIWLKYNLHRSDFEAASQIVLKTKTDTLHRLTLPSEYQYLSMNSGSVNVEKNGPASTVIFYTFLGVPDGKGGIIKVFNGQFDGVKTELFDKVYDVKPLGNNWYYVMGN